MVTWGCAGIFEEGYSGDGHIGTYYAGVWFPDKQELAGGKMATQIISVKSLTALTLSELKYVLMVKNSIYL